VSEDGTPTAQTDRFRPDPLTMFTAFHSQEACQSKIAAMFYHPLQHGGLVAAQSGGAELLTVTNLETD
jgi:hypothetical protein